MKTIFEKIIDRELEGEILYEDDDIICIPDKFPQAPVHILLISKKAIPSIQHIEKEDEKVLAKILFKAKELAKKYGIEDGYRLLTNNGSTAGQTIFHLHFHLIGGKNLTSEV